MEALLDEEEKNKKRPFFWRWGSIILGMLIVGCTTFLYSKLNSKSETLNAKVNNTAIEQNQDKNLNTNGQVGIDTEQVVIKNIPDQKEAEELKKINQSKKIDVEDDALNSKSKKSSLSTLVASTSQNPILEKGQEKTKENGTEKVNSEIIKPQKLATKKSNIQTETASLKSQRSKQTDEFSAIQFKSSDNSQNDITVINGKPMIQISTVTYPQGEMRDETKFNPRYQAALKNYVPEVYDSITILTFKPVDKKVELINELNPKEQSKPSDSFVLKPMNLMMLAGLNMNKGFAGTVEKELKWGLAPYVGVGIEKPISNKITMSSHVGFTYFNGLNVHKTVSSSIYSFGLDSSAISVYYKKMLQIYLPFAIDYQIKHKHYLMASIGASYAMNVLSTYEEFKTSSNGFNSTVNKINTTTTSMKNQLGYQTGINRLDIVLQAGYSYQIFKHSMIQFGIQKGLIDMTKNAYFQNVIKNTQTRISVGIKYSFKRNDN
jgi:hypothetical protein